MAARAVGAGLVLAVVFSTGAFGSSLPLPPPKLTEAQRIAILRSLVAQVGIARRALPPDKHGIEIAPDGRVLNADEVINALNDRGDSARRGDRLAITAIAFKGDRIVFDINGGPHKTHWYNHVAVGMGGTMNPVGTDSQTGPHGAVITVKFPGDLPSLTPDEVKKDLGTLIDWDPPAKAEEMVKPLPPSVRTAINAHRVLVGMNEDMVVAALGRTGNKSRETDAQGRPYEDWVYGQPPQATVFVRFIAGRVTRVTTFDHGTQTVDSTPDPALLGAMQQQRQQAAERAEDAAQPAPTLRRPGDPVPTLRPGAPPPPPPPLGSTSGTPPGMPPQQSPPGRPPVCCSWN